MGSTLQREGPAAATPMQLSSFPTASVYFGSGQQTPPGKEEPRGTGAGRGHLKTAGLVMRQCKTNLTKIRSLGWVGRGGSGLFHDCQGQCAELNTPRLLVPGRLPFPEKPPQSDPNTLVRWPC